MFTNCAQIKNKIVDIIKLATNGIVYNMIIYQRLVLCQSIKATTLELECEGVIYYWAYVVHCI